jgi:hypothetical protein
MSSFTSRFSAVALTALALALATPASAQAQTAPGPRWLGWLGCWSAAPNDQPTVAGADAPRIVCITPTRDADVVDISAIADGKVVSRDHIDASGRPQAINGTCKGSQTARWSADGRRVFLKSSVTCEGVQTDMAALLAMTSGGNWLDVRRVVAGEGTDVRVARYHDVGVPSNLPTEIATALNTRGNFIVQDARVETGAPVGPNALIEASRAVDASIVEAWVMESGQRFAVDARTLTQLADAGVPSRVTDAMISVTNADLADRGSSKVYYYSPYGWNNYGGDYGHYGRGSSDAWDQGTGSRVTVNVYNTYDPWGFAFWPYGGYRYGYAPFGYGFRYGRGQFFGVGLGYPYTYAFGLPFAYGYARNPRNRVGYYYPPVIVLHNDPTNTAPRGRAVRGEGYTPDPRHNGTTEPRTARPRTDGASRAAEEAVRGAANAGRNEPRTAAPRTAEAPRAVEQPRYAEPRSAEPRYTEPRSAEPRPVERRAEPRSEPRTEPRSEPRSSNSSPRSARSRP